MIAHPRAAAEKSTNPRDVKTIRTAIFLLDLEASTVGQAVFLGTGGPNCCLLSTAILVVRENRATAPQKMPFEVQFFVISIRKNLHRNIECYLFCRSLVDCMRSSNPPHPPWPRWRCRTHNGNARCTRCVRYGRLYCRRDDVIFLTAFLTVFLTALVFLKKVFLESFFLRKPLRKPLRKFASWQNSPASSFENAGRLLQ